MANYVTNETLLEALRKTSVQTKTYVDNKFQPIEDENLLTEAKTVVGAINELFKDSSIVSNKTILDSLLYDINNVKNDIVDVQKDVAEAQENIAILQEIVGYVEGETPINLVELINNKANAKDVYTKEESKAIFKQVRYDVCHAPVGTLVDYHDKEIRIMIPADTDFATQENASSTGAENIFYIEVRVYAPENAIGFRTDVNEIAEDEVIEDFNGMYAGIDELGRKYFILYQPVAYYDTESSTWIYYGKKSTISHYVGWTQITEWYDTNGVMIGFDKIRINLSNEDCHFEIKPFYMADIPIIESSEEENKISILEDNTMEVNSVNVNKLTQDDGDYVVFDCDFDI